MSSPLLEQLIESLRVLPGVGQKTAQRMAYHLLDRERDGGYRAAQSIGILELENKRGDNRRDGKEKRELARGLAAHAGKE